MSHFVSQAQKALRLGAVEAYLSASPSAYGQRVSLSVILTVSDKRQLPNPSAKIEVTRRTLLIKKDLR